ncbi:MAG: beta-L-arabinofuranosidase domain-containing protein [Eubacteriales bacterium]
MSEKYSFYTSNEIKPAGWLYRQLKIQAEGLCGNLDKVWPDVRDSAWIGGSREGWERVPYWLDGCVPLAYLLNDADLISRVGHYMDCILERQEPDGWICPVAPEKRRDYDNWVVLLISKVLVRYYDCSGDERVPGALERLMKNFFELLKSGDAELGKWGSTRWYEGFPALRMLWDRSHEPWIRELAKMLHDKGKDYRKSTSLWERPLNKWTMDTHIVNVCEMLKAQTLVSDLLDGEDIGSAEEFYDILKKYNGTAVGTFTGDECLSGISPTQGTELCSVVELMDSMEHLYAYTGDPVWAERLETVAFNALPATVSEDMWTHQYVQMVNQIDCRPFPGRSHFRTNNSEAHIFGLEPHFGCCTANFGQGWPKLTLSAFMESRDGAISAVPIPSVLSVSRGGKAIQISLETEYPFKNTFVYRVESESDTDFVLSVRIPSFAKDLRVNGRSVKKRSMLRFEGFRQGRTDIEIAYDTVAETVARPHRMYCVKKGSLIFALPVDSEKHMVEYEKKGVERKYPYCDYHIKGTSDWNVALVGRDFRTEECEVGNIPFSESHPPIKIHADICHIDWGLEDGFETVCAKYPHSRKPLDSPTERVLIPYGCTCLRMTEMPVI